MCTRASRGSDTITRVASRAGWARPEGAVRLDWEPARRGRPLRQGTHFGGRSLQATSSEAGAIEDGPGVGQQDRGTSAQSNRGPGGGECAVGDDAR